MRTNPFTGGRASQPWQIRIDTPPARPVFKQRLKVVLYVVMVSWPPVKAHQGPSLPERLTPDPNPIYLDLHLVILVEPVPSAQLLAWHRAGR